MPSRSRRRLARVSGVTLILLLATALTGCNQLSAKRNHSRLQRILGQIQVHQGDTRPYVFQQQQTEELESNINQIGDLIAREDYQGAADLARRTMETAPQLRDLVVQDHAAAIRQQAENDIGIAQDNNGQSENADLWDRILQTQEEVREANAEQDWEDVIGGSQSIIDDVATLLLNLRNRANDGLQRARIAMTEFDTWQSRILVSPLVVESERLVANVESLISERRYRLAISSGDEALVKINETIIESKRVLSSQGIARLEDLLSDIIAHGGDFRLPERYRTFGDNFDALLQFFQRQQYDEALTQINTLTPVAQQLVLDTFQAEAQELLALRQREIGELEEAEVRRYLPDRIDLPIDLRTQAQAQFDEALRQIEEIRAIPDSTFQGASAEGTREELLLEEVRPTFQASVQLSLEAGEAIDNIKMVFRELAENHLADSQSAINIAVNVLEQFRGIWDPRVTTAIEPADQQFLDNRELMRREVETRLESARILKATGEFRLNDTPARYNLAIQYADQSRDEAQQVLADTYTIATRYALVELTWMIDYYEREGAGEYVSGELDRTLRLVQETRELLAGGDPREAIAKAADARSQLEIMIQSLRRVANENVEQLRRLEQQTGEVLANIQAPERVELITELRTTAENLARQDQLKDAIETAQRGQRLAETTTTEARREWAESELADAQSRIALAQQAGAAQYAATTLQAARDLADTAGQRLSAGDFTQAQIVAAESATRADEARLALVNQAHEATVRATEYEGWRFNYQALADAQVAERRAREALESGNALEAAQLAAFARERAQEVTRLSQQALFAERMLGLRQSIEHAMATGASYFQPNELASVLNDLSEVETSYTPARHDDAVRAFEALEARMAIIIEGTPEVLEATLNEYRDWIRHLRGEKDADLYAHHELEVASGAILSAQRNFDTGHVRQAYRDVVDGGRVLSRVQEMADEFDYKAAVDDILNQLDDARYQFAAYIAISPRMLTYAAISPGGQGRMTNIVSNYSPSEFRQEVERLQGLADDVRVPRTRADHYHLLLACLRNAQTAARNFEYLRIADRMDERTINNTVAAAYDFLETSHRQSEELTRGLMEYPLQRPVTMTELGRVHVNRAMANSGFGQYHADDARVR